MNSKIAAAVESLNGVDVQPPVQLGTEAKQVIPIMREELTVQIQKYITGIVRVKKIVGEREEFVDQPINKTNFVVERVAINKMLPEPPAVREEGDTMVFSVAEEVLVTTTQYLVKEEIRVSRRQSQTPHHERFLLRTEELVIEREPVAHPSKV